MTKQVCYQGLLNDNVLCCGFIRETVENELINIHFPSILFILINDYYPKYDVYYIYPKEKREKEEN